MDERRETGQLHAAACSCGPKATGHGVGSGTHVKNDRALEPRDQEVHASGWAAG